METIEVVEFIPTVKEIIVEKLTKRQMEYVKAIENYKKENKKVPSIRKICELVGVTSPASAYNIVYKLSEKGYFYDLV